MSIYRQVLVATLGTQPQVVTLAVDLLEEDQDVVVEAVYVIHTAAQRRVGAALARLEEAFDRDRYRGRRCAFRPVPILTPEGRPVHDIRTESDASSTFRTIYGAVLACKQAHQRVHLSIAGGRNSMVVYGAAAAQILFDAGDRLWHLISTAEFEQTGNLHRHRSSDAVLAPIPVLRWSTVSPVLTALVREQDPFSAVQAQERLVERQADLQREEFLREELTPAEWRVVGDFVTHGGTDRDIAARLNISHRTVSTHLQRVYSKMHSFFAYDLAVSVKRETVMQQFSGFFKRHPHLVSPPVD